MKTPFEGLLVRDGSSSNELEEKQKRRRLDGNEKMVEEEVDELDSTLFFDFFDFVCLLAEFGVEL